MNPKLLILKLLLNRETWSEYRQFIKVDDDKHLKLLYTVLDRLLGESNTSVTLDEFKATVALETDLRNERDKETLAAFLDILTTADVSESVLKDFLIKIKQRDIAEKLANTSYEFVEGYKTLDDIHKVYGQFETIEKEVQPSEFVTDDIEELYQLHLVQPGLRWRLNSLNRMLGSLRKGDFGFLFARPETGKTTFLASEVTHFAGQTDRPILWLNNEEQGWKVISRCYQAALGMTHEEVMHDRAESKRRFFEITKGNILLLDDASIYRRKVEDLCNKYSPSLVVIDQIDKIKGFEGDREDLLLGKIYQWSRELAKKYCPIIGVSQADGTGEGVKWLNMKHVANAKTSKQAEADFIIGIGKTAQDGMEYVRHINISKNKLTGDEDSDPALRHGKVDVIIEPQISRYKDIGH